MISSRFAKYCKFLLKHPFKQSHVISSIKPNLYIYTFSNKKQQSFQKQIHSKNPKSNLSYSYKFICWVFWKLIPVYSIGILICMGMMIYETYLITQNWINQNQQKNKKTFVQEKKKGTNEES